MEGERRCRRDSRGNLARERDRAYLFRTLGPLRADIPLFDSVDQIEWRGPTPAFEPIGTAQRRRYREDREAPARNRQSSIASPA